MMPMFFSRHRRIKGGLFELSAPLHALLHSTASLHMVSFVLQKEFASQSPVPQVFRFKFFYLWSLYKFFLLRIKT